MSVLKDDQRPLQQLREQAQGRSALLYKRPHVISLTQMCLSLVCIEVKEKFQS